MENTSNPAVEYRRSFSDMLQTLRSIRSAEAYSRFIERDPEDGLLGSVTIHGMVYDLAPAFDEEKRESGLWLVNPAANREPFNYSGEGAILSYTAGELSRLGPEGFKKQVLQDAEKDLRLAYRKGLLPDEVPDPEKKERETNMEKPYVYTIKVNIAGELPVSVSGVDEAIEDNPEEAIAHAVEDIDTGVLQDVDYGILDDWTEVMDEDLFSRISIGGNAQVQVSLPEKLPSFEEGDELAYLPCSEETRKAIRDAIDDVDIGELSYGDDPVGYYLMEAIPVRKQEEEKQETLWPCHPLSDAEKEGDAIARSFGAEVLSSGRGEFFHHLNMGYRNSYRIGSMLVFPGKHRLTNPYKKEFWLSPIDKQTVSFFVRREDDHAPAVREQEKRDEQQATHLAQALNAAEISYTCYPALAKEYMARREATRLPDSEAASLKEDGRKGSLDLSRQPYLSYILHDWELEQERFSHDSELRVVEIARRMAGDGIHMDAIQDTLAKNSPYVVRNVWFHNQEKDVIVSDPLCERWVKEGTAAFARDSLFLQDYLQKKQGIGSDYAYAVQQTLTDSDAEAILANYVRTGEKKLDAAFCRKLYTKCRHRKEYKRIAMNIQAGCKAVPER